MTSGEFTAGSSWRDWFARRLGLRGEDKLEIYSGVAASADLTDVTYWTEIVFSAGIATLGLTLNSPAVIIGGMLISPLMGPIMSGGLALAAGDFLLGLRAVTSILLSSVAAIIFSTILVALLPFREMTAEIAARTHPNSLDLIVALFSGAVAALAVCKRVSGLVTSIPGVAIAVALMPPLCVTGYGVGVLVTLDRAQGMAIVRGGSLLFVTNLVAITFSSMLVFLLVHVDSSEVRERIRGARAERGPTPYLGLLRNGPRRELSRIGSLPARLLLITALVAAVFVPLKRSFDALADEIRERQRLNAAQRAATKAWEELFARTTGGAARSYIDGLEALEHDGRLTLTIRAFTSQSVTPEERENYVRTVARQLSRPRDSVHLSLLEIPTTTYHVEQVKAHPATPEAPAESVGARFAGAAHDVLSEIAAVDLPPGATAVDATITAGAEPPLVVVTYVSPVPISADAQALIAADVHDRTDLASADVRLVWVPARVAVRFRSRSAAIVDDAGIGAVGSALARSSRLHVTMSVPPDQLGGDRAASVRNALTARGAKPAQIATIATTGPADGDAIVVTVTSDAVDTAPPTTVTG